MFQPPALSAVRRCFIQGSESLCTQRFRETIVSSLTEDLWIQHLNNKLNLWWIQRCWDFCSYSMDAKCFHHRLCKIHSSEKPPDSYTKTYQNMWLFSQLPFIHQVNLFSEFQFSQNMVNRNAATVTGDGFRSCWQLFLNLCCFINVFIIKA